jgi:hypothetical protein
MIRRNFSLPPGRLSSFFFYKTSKPKRETMNFRLIVLLIFTIFPLLFSGCLEVVETTPLNKPIDTFDILINTAGDISIKDKNVTILVRILDTEIVNWKPTHISFITKPTPTEGKTVDDYATIYFSAENFNTQIFKFNGAYQIKWLIDNDDMFYESGSKTMNYMTDYNISVSFSFNIFELSKLSFSNLTLNFRNKENTWIEKYNVRFVVVNG